VCLLYIAKILSDMFVFLSPCKVTVVLPPSNAFLFEKEDQEPSDTMKVAEQGDSGGSKVCGAGSCNTAGELEFAELADPAVDEDEEGEVEEEDDEEEEDFDSANLGLDSDL